VPVAATGDAPGDAAVSPGLGLLPVVVLPPQAAKLRAIAIAEIAVVSRFELIKLRRKSIGIKTAIVIWVSRTNIARNSKALVNNLYS
jgi:hypothetical protein